MNALGACLGNSQHVANLHARALIGCDYVRLHDYHHSLFEGEAMTGTTRRPASAQKWGIDPTDCTVDEGVADRENHIVDLLRDVQDRFARRAGLDGLANFFIDVRRQRMEARILAGRLSPDGEG